MQLIETHVRGIDGSDGNLWKVDCGECRLDLGVGLVDFQIK